MSALDYTVEKDGEKNVVDDHHVMNELKGLGYPVTGVSADGTTLTLSEPAAGKAAPSSYQVPIPAALKALGYTVHHAVPTSSASDAVDSMLTAQVNSLPEDDDMRKTFIESKLKRRGIEAPVVAGKGGEWHAYNPNTNQWAKLTEEPNFHSAAGLAGEAAGIPHMAGMVVGGIAGGAGASIPGAMAGAGVGSLGGQALSQGAQSFFDPAYREAMASHPGRAALDDLKTAGIDAATEGIAGPLMKYAPFEKIGNVAGHAVEGVGDLASSALGRLAKSDWVSNLAGGMAAPTTDLASMAAQAPREAIRAAAKIPRRIADSDLLGSFLSEENRAGLSNLSENLLSGGDTARGILGSAGKLRRAGAQYAEEGWPEVEKEASEAARQLAEAHGLGDVDTSSIANAAAKDFRNDYTRQMLPNMSEEGALPKIGSTIDRFGNAGSGINDLLTSLGRAGLRAGQGAGMAAKASGPLLRNTGSMLQYGGIPLLLRKGLVDPALERRRDK